MSKWPKVSVVMSNYNGLKLNILTESVSSILKNNYPSLEVILVDNASTDKSVDTIKRKFGRDHKLIILQNPINMYSQGLNLGIKNSNGKYIAFFNNDVVVENGYFQKMVSFLEKNRDVALVQGKLLSYFDHSVIDSAGETTDIYGSPITIGAHQKEGINFDKETEVLSVSGSCSILRGSVIERIGMFDEDYGIGFEDLDIAIRSWLAGYKVKYYPNAIAFHRRGVTDLSDEIRVKVRWHFNKNRIMTMLKNYPVRILVKSLPITFLIYVATGLLEIFLKRKTALGLTRFSSILWVLWNLGSILKKRNQIQRGAKGGFYRLTEKLFYSGTLKQGFLSFIKVK